MIGTCHQGPNPLRIILSRTAFQERHFPQLKTVDLDPLPPLIQTAPLRECPSRACPKG